ncbi:GNAT family N-acetyltransferase [Leifsonia sp. McL0607]|uniref:GNAT family N-acetyltransferase n=1 Tax=Leifsonia sp. McL0607 TaxID=3415672 RepID=UPI003CED5920
MLVLRPFDVSDFAALRSWAPTEDDVYLFAGTRQHWPLTDAILTSWLTAEGVTPWTAHLASAPGTAVGHIELVRTGPTTGRLARVILDPGMRGRGNGRHLVSAAIDAARIAGVNHLSLNVITTNAAAFRTYLSLGFTDAGPNPEHPTMTIMEATLQDAPSVTDGRQ